MATNNNWKTFVVKKVRPGRKETDKPFYLEVGRLVIRETEKGVSGTLYLHPCWRIFGRGWSRRDWTCGRSSVLWIECSWRRISRRSFVVCRSSMRTLGIRYTDQCWWTPRERRTLGAWQMQIRRCGQIGESLGVEGQRADVRRVL